MLHRKRKGSNVFNRLNPQHREKQNTLEKIPTKSFLGAFKGLTLSSLEKSLIQNTASPKMSNEKGTVGVNSNYIPITCYKISESLL